MDERFFLDVISGERRGLPAELLRGVLSALSLGYGIGVRLRNRLFEAGWRQVHRVPLPVISVGNLTTGGTGKTPFVAWLIQNLQRRGEQPALISRGYKAVPTSAEEATALANDEARVIEWLCPGVPHMQQRNRVKALESFGLRMERQTSRAPSDPQPSALGPQRPSVIVLDDGFQHRRLHRDLDVVLIDALRPWGYGRLLPRGLLREPLSAIWRADLVVLSRVDLVDEEHLQELRHQVRRLRGAFPDAELAFRPTRLVNAHGQSQPLSALKGIQAGAFCGIGNPAGFAKTLAALGVSATPQPFPDHHAYTTADWDALARDPADVLLCTLKDLVKLPAEHPLARRAWAVDIGVEWRKGDEVVSARLSATMTTKRRTAA